MRFVKKKKKSKKNKNKSGSSSGIASFSTFVSLAVIICLFQWFLYKRIENLNIEKEKNKADIEDLGNEKTQYKSDFNLMFDQNVEMIANRFYGVNKWKKQTLIKKHIILD
tara:strand:+ start:995 stop:1324 length:330 start_codon:yes stop_codon:yes gene_type:complete